jgi:hypothetical protein
MLMFWVLTSTELHVDTSVKEEYSASVFRAENQKSRSSPLWKLKIILNNVV